MFLLLKVNSFTHISFLDFWALYQANCLRDHVGWVAVYTGKQHVHTVFGMKAFIYYWQICKYMTLKKVFYTPLVMASPLLSWANRAERWAALLSGFGPSSVNVGGGGGGGGGQGVAGSAINRDELATGPCKNTAISYWGLGCISSELSIFKVFLYTGTATWIPLNKISKGLVKES